MRYAILGACLAVGMMAFGVGSAQALEFIPHELERTIDGSESPGGSFGGEISSIAVDQHTGDFYVLTAQTGISLYKFDAQGHPSNFSSTGSSMINLGAANTFQEDPKVRVDNSSVRPGRIYVSNDFITDHIWAFEPSGAPVGGDFPLPFGTEDLAVSPISGDFYETGEPLTEHAYQFSPEGKKTGTVVDMSQHGFRTLLEAGPNDELITYAYEHGLMKYSLSSEVLGTIPSGGSRFFAVDQVSGDILSLRGAEGALYDNDGDQLPGLTLSAGGEERAAALNGVNHYIYVAHRNTVEVFKPLPTTTLASATNQPPTNVHATSLQLNASVEPSGVETTECEFEYGTSATNGTIVYADSAPCEQGQKFTGTGPTPVSATLTGLSQGGTYHWRLRIGNANGAYHTRDAIAIPSEPPVVTNPYVTEAHSDSILFNAEITPEGGATTFHVLYGTGDCVADPGSCSQTRGRVGRGRPRRDSGDVQGDRPDAGDDLPLRDRRDQPERHHQNHRSGRSRPSPSPRCWKTSARTRTSASRPAPRCLADCRAYELVSAANANGYDVESYLTEGQMPFGGYPEAEGPSRILYGVHDGALPGTGHPTNHGIDPYVATRGEDGWSTSYVGVPANTPYSKEAFASPVAGADAALDTFAFGGAGLCSPCFGDGSTGIPVRLADGSLVQGMAGPANPGSSAKPNMLVKKPLSANGKHLIFGSTENFVGGAGTPAIYDRDLETDTTVAISNLPGGGPILCTLGMRNGRPCRARRLRRRLADRHRAVARRRSGRQRSTGTSTWPWATPARPST